MKTDLPIRIAAVICRVPPRLAKRVGEVGEIAAEDPERARQLLLELGTCSPAEWSLCTGDHVSIVATDMDLEGRVWVRFYDPRHGRDEIARFPLTCLCAPGRTTTPFTEETPPWLNPREVRQARARLSSPQPVLPPLERRSGILVSSPSVRESASHVPAPSGQ